MGEPIRRVDCEASGTGAGNSHTVTLKRQIVRGGALLGANEVLTQVLRFARNIVLARILSPEDFGIAAVCAMAATFLEMTTDLGLQRMVVQAKDGDDERFIATAHLVLLLRGLLIGIAVFLVARPMALMFNVPQATSAFRMVSLLPVLDGLNHCDMVRFQRVLRFGPSVLCRLLPAAASTAAALPVALWIRNYWALVILAMGVTCLRLVFSHVFSDRPYRIRWDKRILIRFLDFGWPLLVNGLLMYGILQGDQWIVGKGYGMEMLGVYFIAITLVRTPTLMLAKVNSSVMLPLLSRVQDDRAQLVKRYSFASQVMSLMAGVIVIPLIVAGGELITLVYGDEFSAAAGFVGWLAVMQMVRLTRTPQTSLAMALGDTKNPMMANVFRSLALVPALLAAVNGFGLVWIAIYGFGGEVLAFCAATGRLYGRHRISVRPSAKAAIIPIVAASLAGVAKCSGLAGADWTTLGLATAAVLGLTLLAGFFVHDQLRDEVLLAVKQRLNGRKAGLQKRERAQA